ncbi:MAG: DUF2911 domain-containing protein [Acidobacteriota bacterium]|nr:DUF2911 domain-containing protein [Acidobacteriota bacterium]
MSSSSPTRILALSLILAAAAAGLAVAQDLHPSRRPSPMGLARTHVDDAYVSITYSRPYKRGRDNIFGTAESGALVPFGEVWRTGANEATQLTATRDVLLGGQRLPAGTYSVFSTPGADSWKIHLNSRLGLNGTAARNPETGEFEDAYSAENNVLELEVAPGSLAEEVDQFTISFEDQEDGSVHMVWRWITTEIRVPVASAG